MLGDTGCEILSEALQQPGCRLKELDLSRCVRCERVGEVGGMGGNCSSAAGHGLREVELRLCLWIGKLGDAEGRWAVPLPA